MIFGQSLYIILYQCEDIRESHKLFDILTLIFYQRSDTHECIKLYQVSCLLIFKFNCLALQSLSLIYKLYTEKLVNFTSSNAIIDSPFNSAQFVNIFSATDLLGSAVFGPPIFNLYISNSIGE
ncbi:hypothetical protein FGO68_gene7914 [Halteria grandinella]|uniref:Uncharacterized protein n=1 Tax=Halteria grandinella TaxID=5974 RepID=A0A8J8NGP6_HALGN|nr:hypothetical protein FGO68_gene7914 [Halteria grandinella]